MLLLILLAALGADDPDHLAEVRVYKQNRSTYIRLINKVRDAEQLLATDPAASAEKCTEVIDSHDIDDSNKEARIRIEYAKGGWGDWTVILPYQIRGRARYARAQVVGQDSRIDAADLARKAVDDLKKSLSLGADSSRPFLTQAEDLLRKLQTPVAPPVVKETKPPAQTPDVTTRQLSDQLEAMMKEIERLKGEVDRLNHKDKDAPKTPPAPEKKE